MSSSRRGFTLVELLVVIGIIVLLTSLVVWSLAGSRQADLAASAARNLQAQILATRDRAVQAKAPRGVRLIRDPAHTDLVRGGVPLQPAPVLLRYGEPNSPFQMERPDVAPADGRADSNEITMVRGLSAGLDWLILRDQGDLSVPFRVRIPADTGDWYEVVELQSDSSHPERPLARLAKSLPEEDLWRRFDQVVAIPATSTRATCELDLGWKSAMVGEADALPAGVVIDLRRSAIPLEWGNPGSSLDLICGPTGVFSTGGGTLLNPVYLILRDQHDADLDLDPADPRCVGSAAGLAIIPRTGRVESFALDLTDLFDNDTQASGPDGRADDLFRFARTAPGGHP